MSPLHINTGHHDLEHGFSGAQFIPKEGGNVKVFGHRIEWSGDETAVVTVRRKGEVIDRINLLSGSGKLIVVGKPGKEVRKVSLVHIR